MKELKLVVTLQYDETKADDNFVKLLFEGLVLADLTLHSLSAGVINVQEETSYVTDTIEHDTSGGLR